MLCCDRILKLKALSETDIVMKCWNAHKCINYSFWMEMFFIQELLLCIYINELSILTIRVIIDGSEGFVKVKSLWNYKSYNNK
jgi:hypothetical protein